MHKKDNIAGALEGNVHIPRVFPQRDGALISSTGFVMWAMSFVLIIVAVASARSGSFSYLESSIKMFITGFAGLVLFYITVPFFLIGSIYMLKGRKNLPQGSKTSIVTGFIIFQILLFITLFSTPLYYTAALNSSPISSSVQSLIAFLETLFFVAWFLMLIPYTSGEKRKTFITGFVLMVVPLGIFTFISFISTGMDSFFLSPLPLYIVRAIFYTTVSAVLFWIFQSLREFENNIQAVSFIRKRPQPVYNAENNMEDSSTEVYPEEEKDDESFNHGGRPPASGSAGELYPGGSKTPDRYGRAERLTSLFTMKEDQLRRKGPMERKGDHDDQYGGRYEW